MKKLKSNTEHQRQVYYYVYKDFNIRIKILKLINLLRMKIDII